MALNGIDISNWQSGINLAVVPCDFVVIKATEGTGYVNPDYERAYRQAKTAGKCLGIYHYASGGNIQAEAEYFLKNAGSRVGEAMLVLDWEGRSNPAFGVNINTGDFLSFADYFFDGFVVDWMVQDRINNARHQVEEAIRRTEYIINQLQHM